MSHYKGYGLSIVVELLGGGEGCAAGERTMVSNGVLFTVYSITHFTSLDTYYDEVEDLIRHVKSSRLAPGFQEILSPGEPEFRTAERKQVEGIEMMRPPGRLSVRRHVASVSIQNVGQQGRNFLARIR